MSLKVCNNIIEIDGRRLFSAPAKIERAYEVAEGVLLMYDADSILPLDRYYPPDNPPRLTEQQIEDASRNVLLIDIHGEIIWRIEPSVPIWARDWDYGWSAVYQDRGQWQIVRPNGWYYDLDLSTGKLSNMVQGK